MEIVHRQDRSSLPIKMWLPDLADAPREQAINCSQLPFAFKHIAIMPDSHKGFGLPIGGVMATRDVVIPYAVGVDIGCGMIAVKTNIHRSDIKYDTELKLVLENIRRAIPVSHKSHDEPQDLCKMPLRAELPLDGIVHQEFAKARTQLGTLGGGNHFIEIQADSHGYIWVMIHSGSRNLGHKVATHYDKVAQKLNASWHTKVPKKHKLAFLPLDSDEGQEYMREMKFCIEFAEANRALMMNRTLEALESALCREVNQDIYINKVHNEAVMEHHFGENVMIHRKGATRARDNEYCIIPGSMGTFSYIGRGLGNPDSFHSCSHGAGRALSRTAAKEKISLEKTIASLDAKGIIHGIRHQNDLEEAPDAYKDIDKVMALQTDLVEVEYKLTPLAVVKG